jgi:hypothetical protein
MLSSFISAVQTSTDIIANTRQHQAEHAASLPIQIRHRSIKHQQAGCEFCWLQIMAAVRCKQSKMRFFWGALFGKTWREDDLFHPEALVQGRANQMLQQYKSSSQVGVKPDQLLASRVCMQPHALLLQKS